MWRVVFQRHFLNSFYKTNIYESSSKFKASLMFEYYAFKYIMSPLPIKILSLYKLDKGIISLEDCRIKSQNRELLRNIEK